MFYIIYKTTNLINNKIYIGQHITDKLHDNYVGSGTLLKKAIQKYGDVNFHTDILFICKSKEEMNCKEQDLVNEEFIKRADTYNLILGGTGGNKLPSGHWTQSVDNIKQMNQARLNKMLIDPKLKATMLNACISGGKSTSKYLKEETDFYKNFWVSGRAAIAKNIEEVTRKRKETYIRIGHQQGSKNSQFGKRWKWLYNEDLQKDIKLPKDSVEISVLLNQGWQLGRCKRHITKS